MKYETKAPLPLSFSSPPPLTRNYAASEHSENIYKLFANLFKLLFRTKIRYLFIYVLICVSHCTNQLDSGVDAGWNGACIIPVILIVYLVFSPSQSRHSCRLLAISCPTATSIINGEKCQTRHYVKLCHFPATIHTLLSCCFVITHDWSG